MNKLLCIVGPTASGKTSLAVKLAKIFDGQIISADSRQVYQGMDIGTGKDLPQDAQPQTQTGLKHSCYSFDGIRLWGYDLAEPTQEFERRHFHDFSWDVIKHLWQNQTLPIIAGGTGFYINALMNPPKSLNIPPNQKLRDQLEKLPTQALQNRLKKINQKKFNQLNKSDKQNPRRLIRAIEVTQSHLKPKPSSESQSSIDPLIIGLKVSLSVIDQRIADRVQSRLKAGFEQEVTNLVKQNDLKPDSSAATATGYKQWLQYLDGQTTKSEAIQKWITAEQQYARRQYTWFRKIPDIHWIDLTQKNARKLVVQKVRNWYA